MPLSLAGKAVAAAIALGSVGAYEMAPPDMRGQTGEAHWVLQQPPSSPWDSKLLYESGRWSRLNPPAGNDSMRWSAALFRPDPFRIIHPAYVEFLLRLARRYTCSFQASPHGILEVLEQE